MLTSLSCSAPVTSLTVVEHASAPLVLAGSATQLIVSPLSSPQGPTSSRRWDVLHRERVHGIISRATGSGWEVLVSGGKEATLLELRREEGSHSLEDIEVKLLHRFALPDWVQNIAFLGESEYLFLTSHNSLLHCAVSASGPKLLRTIHCPLRPLLWCGSFSRSCYTSLLDVRIAGGTMLWDVLSWSLENLKLDAEEQVTADLSSCVRLDGHQGAIFNVSHSPTGRYLASGSDDRTIRVWDLQAAAEGREVLVGTLWGHEGRVWRLKWLDETTLASVAEDTLCKIWTLKMPSSAATAEPTPLGYSVLASFANGHDGRSLWSLSATSVAADDGLRSPKRRIILTGGADGVVRSWLIPLSAAEASEASQDGFLAHLDTVGTIRSFTISTDPRTGSQEGLFLNADGALYHSPLSPTPSSPRLLLTSPHFKSPTLLHVYFSPEAGRVQAWVFTNRGVALRVGFSVDGAGDVGVLERDIGVAAVSLTAEGTMAILTERRGEGRVCIVDMGCQDSIPVVSSITCAAPHFTTPRECIIRTVTSLPSLPQSSTSTLLLLGTASGSLILASFPSDVDAEAITLARITRYHTDGITDCRMLTDWSSSKDEASLEVETLGRDGVRSVVKLSQRQEGWAMIIVGQQQMTKGLADQILLPSRCDPRKGRRYVALQETSAVVSDASGTQLFSFSSPGHAVPRLFVDDAQGTHLYRLVKARIHRQTAPLPLRSLPPPILLPGLPGHGREIRAVAMRRIMLEDGKNVTLVATGAENAVLKVSLVDPVSKSLVPIYSDHSIPSPLKAVAWASSASDQLFLFHCGTGESMGVSLIDVAASASATTGVHLRARPWATAPPTTADDDKEKGQIRVMDLAVRSFPGDERLLVVAGYSDGKLRAWIFDPSAELKQRFHLIASSLSYGKCILTVKLVEVKGALLAVSGASDGLLSITDVTLGTLSSDLSPASLPLPIVTYRPHQSGINALDLCYNPSDRLLLIATAGDDNAVAVRRAHLSPSGALLLNEQWSATLPHAHGSTIQGLKFLSSTLLASSSVDQRLNVYRLFNSAPPSNSSIPPRLEHVDALCLGVADCSAMDVLADATGDHDSENVQARRRKWELVVVGIGAEVVEFQLEG